MGVFSEQLENPGFMSRKEIPDVDEAGDVRML
jgi:hypothetical protein